MRDDHLLAFAHELSRVSAALLEATRVLTPCPERSGEQERALAGIVHHATRLDRLAGNVLAAHRNTGPGPCTPVAPVARQVVAEVASFPEPRRVRLLLDEELHTAADDAALHTVLSNLLTNALRFAAPGSRVELVARAEGAHAALHVTNVGPAIPADALERVFEPFTSGLTPGDPLPGFGHGLFVVRSLVGAHGGRVTAANGPGGVTFSVHLPVAATPGTDEVELLGIQAVGASWR